MNVEERKQQARNFEQQGELASALELYQEILSELEGTQGIWRELPLYVKAGDLSLKMGDATAAISQYEKAARAYAAYGSAKSVIALCTKVLRVNPEHTHAFLRLVRLMIERNHLAEARLVLLAYADRMKLPKAHSVLENSADRTDEELKPLLELLLELGGRYEYARAQGRDQQPEAETGRDERGAEVEAKSTENAELSGHSLDDSGNLRSQEQLGPKFGVQAEGDPVDQRPVGAEHQQAVEEDSEARSEEEPGLAAALPSSDEIQWVDARPSARLSGSRHSRRVLFREAEKRHKLRGLWIGLGIAAVVVVGGLGLVLFNVISFGSGNGATENPPRLAPQPALSDSASAAGAELEDSTDNDGDNLANTSVDATTTEAAAADLSGQERTRATVDSSGPEGTEGDSLITAAVPAGDTTADDQTGVPAAPEPPPSQGVRVQDFGVESTTEFVADGRVGYRTTQLLGTGERLTLSAIYYGKDIASAPGTEEMTLAPLVGDTTTAMIHFNGYAVEARAIVSASVLEALLGRLVEVSRSD